MPSDTLDRPEYAYGHARHSPSDAYLWPPVLRELARLPPGTPRRVFDLGCGNGIFLNELSRHGFEAVGVDVSESGVEQGRVAFPGIDIHVGSAYDDLNARFGTFPAVVSLEVVEHVYDPWQYARTLHQLLDPGGVAIVSTPYHGYLKNVALALSGKMDSHFMALQNHGHIKFWSRRSLRSLLEGVGFTDVRFDRVGRIKPLAMSMIAYVRKR